MIVGDSGAAICTLSLALLIQNERLEMWSIYLLVAVSAAFNTLQWPAYSAATTLLVKPQDLGRANGLVQLAQAAADIIAPALAGILVLTIGLGGVILIDMTTFMFAVMTLLIVRIPKPLATTATTSTQDAWWETLMLGWRYIMARPGLRGLLAFFVLVNFLWAMVGALITPLILAFTTSDVLGLIVSIAGLGMFSGSLVMSIWGGPRRRINGVIRFELISGLCFMLIGWRPAFWPIVLGVFGAHLTIAIVYSSNQAIWQTKVPADVQGRVFAAQQMLARAASPLAYALAGFIGEKVFEPLLVSGGPLASSLGQVVGVGAGRGLGLLFILMGVLKVVISLYGYIQPHIRAIEDELPDLGIEVSANRL